MALYFRVLHFSRALIGVACLAACAQQPDNAASDFAAPFIPTPETLVAKGLQLAELDPGRLHFDLGSGDGRWVIAAARDFGAQSVGYEIDPELVASSRRRIEELGLADRARIEQGDLFEVDFSRVDLVTTYLLPAMLERLRPLFEAQLKPGAMVLSYDFPVPEWEADRMVTVPGEGRLQGLDHKLYLYRR